MIGYNTIGEEIKKYIHNSLDSINIIISEMLLVLENNKDYLQLLDRQRWYQIICKDISGQESLDAGEREKNRSIIELYICELLESIIANDYIDNKTLLMLALRLNSIMPNLENADRLLETLKDKLDNNLDEESISLMLNDAMGQNIPLENRQNFAIISKVVSLLNPQIISPDDGQFIIEILENDGTMNDYQSELIDIICELVNVGGNEAGYLLLYFGGIRELIMANILEKSFLEYYLMSNEEREIKEPRDVVSKVLSGSGVNLEDTLTSREYFQILLSAYGNEIEDSDDSHDQKKIQEQEIRAYIDDAKKFVNLICKMVETWYETEANLNYVLVKKKYTDFLYGVRDALSEQADTGIMIHSDVCNLTFLAKTLTNRYSFLQIDHIMHYDRRLNVENACIEGLDNKDGESVYYSLDDTYNNFLGIVGIGVGKKFAINRFPRILADTNLQFFGSEYIELYDFIFDNILLRIEEDEKLLSEIYEIFKRFPIEYRDYFEPALIRPKTSFKDIPHVEFNYYHNGDMYNDTNEVEKINRLPDYETLKINIRFCNVPVSKYTVIYETIKNEYEDWSDYNCKRGRAADLRWGEWVGDNTVEFYIKKRKEAIGNYVSFKIKIFVKEYPEISGILNFSS